MNKEESIEILRKDYWKRISPTNTSKRVESKKLGGYSSDSPIYIGIKQSDFLREYDPAGHKVHCIETYPNIVKYNERTGEYFEEEISRVSFSFQQIILTKQLNALCGNPTRFRLPIAEQTKEHELNFSEWKEGWAVKDMDILIHNAYESIGKTGDVAVYMYIDRKTQKMRYCTFSFDKGDLLFPHYDRYGDLELFARKYTSIAGGGKTANKVDVYTKDYIYNLIEDDMSVGGQIEFIEGKYSIEGYRLTGKPIKHGLPFCPIAYYRDERGAWWSYSQKTIEEFEWAFSCLTHNNKAYAFPIMYTKGSKIEITADLVRNSVKAISMPSKDSEAGFLDRPDGSSSFELQLKKLYDMIFLQSFAVNPPEVRSGDLPGVAIKLLYSPSIEKAGEMSRKLNPFLDSIVDMFTYFYGIEVDMLQEFKDLKVYAYQEPYVHQNDSEVINNLETARNSGFLSMKTATEVSPFSNNNEMQRIKDEEEALAQQDLLEDLTYSIDGNKEEKVIDKNEEEDE